MIVGRGYMVMIRDDLIKRYSTNAGKLTSELIFGISSVMAQHLDVSIDKKVSLLAAIATQKDNLPLHMELKMAVNP